MFNKTVDKIANSNIFWICWLILGTCLTLYVGVKVYIWLVEKTLL